jgi:hypothetical protein
MYFCLMLFENCANSNNDKSFDVCVDVFAGGCVGDCGARGDCGDDKSFDVCVDVCVGGCVGDCGARGYCGDDKLSILFTSIWLVSLLMRIGVVPGLGWT